MANFGVKLGTTRKGFGLNVHIPRRQINSLRMRYRNAYKRMVGRDIPLTGTRVGKMGVYKAKSIAAIDTGAMIKAIDFKSKKVSETRYIVVITQHQPNHPRSGMTKPYHLAVELNLPWYHGRRPGHMRKTANFLRYYVLRGTQSVVKKFLMSVNDKGEVFAKRF